MQVVRKRKKSFSQKNLRKASGGLRGKILLDALFVPENESGYQGTHIFHPYPGRFHHRLASVILDQAMPEARSLLDPFMGGGTSLIEGQLRGLDVRGNDLNPISPLIVEQKLRVISEEECEHYAERLEDLAESVRSLRLQKIHQEHSRFLATYYPPHTFAEMLCWSHTIRRQEKGPWRDFLRALFSAGAVKFSQLRDDKKAQVKRPRGAFSRFMEEKGKQLLEAQLEQGEEVPEETVSPSLTCGDVLDLDLSQDPVDLILTSPPYPGTYDYSKHHELRMRWLNLPMADMEKKEWGSRRNEGLKGWQRSFQKVLQAMAKQISESGRIYMVIGDWVDGETRIDALAYLRKVAPKAGLSVSSFASVERENFYGPHRKAYETEGKWEHLIELQRA